MKDLADNVPEDGLDEDQWKLLTSEIHTQSVREAKDALASNQVLGEPSGGQVSVYSTTEDTVHPVTALGKAQFSTHFSPGSILDTPSSAQIVGTNMTNHLFDCMANPTDMMTRDLWENPVDAPTFSAYRQKHDGPDGDRTRATTTTTCWQQIVPENLPVLREVIFKKYQLSTVWRLLLVIGKSAKFPNIWYFSNQ